MFSEHRHKERMRISKVIETTTMLGLERLLQSLELEHDDIQSAIKASSIMRDIKSPEFTDDVQVIDADLTERCTLVNRLKLVAYKYATNEKDVKTLQYILDDRLRIYITLKIAV